MSQLTTITLMQLHCIRVFTLLLPSAHRRFGRLPWASLFAPAIKMASEGIVISEETAKAINFSIPRVQKGNLNLRLTRSLCHELRKGYDFNSRRQSAFLSHCTRFKSSFSFAPCSSSRRDSIGRELIFNKEQNRFYRQGDLFKNEKLAAGEK